MRTSAGGSAAAQHTTAPAATAQARPQACSSSPGPPAGRAPATQEMQKAAMRCQLGAATSDTQAEKGRADAADRTGRAGAAGAAAAAGVVVVWVGVCVDACAPLLPPPADCCTGVGAAAADTASVARVEP